VKYPPVKARSTASVAVPTDTTESPKVFIDLKNTLDFAFLLRWTLRFIGLDPDTIPALQIPSPACRSMLALANKDPEIIGT
jgi:hypothetical protein